MFFRHNILWMLWAILILLLCLMPGSDAPKSHIPYLDKIVHVFLYLVLTELFLVGFIKQSVFKNLRENAAIIAISLAISFGVVVEIIQGTVLVTRSIEIIDMVANAIGSGFGFAAFKIIFLTTKTKSHGIEKKSQSQP